MRVDRLLQEKSPTLSFEFFPPKTDEGFTALYRTIEELKPLGPSYVSVTYGAGGSTRAKTVELTGKIQTQIGINSMAHLTCVGHTREEIGSVLGELTAGGVESILALRGDPPAGAAMFTPTPGGFANANELVSYIAGHGRFAVGVAGYPEGHPTCLNKTRDLEHLKQKVDAGARFIVTQLFFDNNDFLRWRDHVHAIGIRVPIVAGIMPITNVAQIKRFVTMCGAKIPQSLLVKLESIETDPVAVAKAGVEHSLGQCRGLLKQQVAGLHFYTLNKSHATADICQQLRMQ